MSCVVSSSPGLVDHIVSPAAAACADADAGAEDTMSVNRSGHDDTKQDRGCRGHRTGHSPVREHRAGGDAGVKVAVADVTGAEPASTNSRPSSTSRWRAQSRLGARRSTGRTWTPPSGRRSPSAPGTRACVPSRRRTASRTRRSGPSRGARQASRVRRRRGRVSGPRPRAPCGPENHGGSTPPASPNRCTPCPTCSNSAPTLERVRSSADRVRVSSHAVARTGSGRSSPLHKTPTRLVLRWTDRDVAAD